MRPAMRKALETKREKETLRRAVTVVKKVFGGCKVLAVPSKGWVGVRTFCKSCGASYPEWSNWCGVCGD